MLRLSDIKIPAAPPEAEKAALEAYLRRLFQGKLPAYRIARHSLDARKKPALYAVYSLDVSLENAGAEQQFLRKNRKIRAAVVQESVYVPPLYRGNDNPRVLVVGAGPAGLFAALCLARAGLKPLLLEQGAPVEERQRDVETFWQDGTLKPWSNVQFGEGGAGTFSDGKLSSGIKDPAGRIAYMLDAFIQAGAPESIRYEAKPHVGTDVLRRVVRGLREAILEAGGTIRFHTRMTELVAEQGCLTGIRTRHCLSGAEEVLSLKALVLAPGHSARECFRMLHSQGVAMESKPFAAGLRIQHSQAQINQDQYGANPPAYLPAAEYKLTAKARDGRGVYSFCMCPGGYVVNASSQAGRLCVNGMSDAARDGDNANAALAVQILPADTAQAGLFGGMEFQEKLEEMAFAAGAGKIPVQRWADFEKACDPAPPTGVQPACKGAWTPAPLHRAVPDFMRQALLDAMPQFERILPGFSREDAILCGVESRTSSPLRILRDDTGESNLRRLFPCGEGAGYAGGITSAAVDGIRSAEAVIRALEKAEGIQ